MSGTAQQDPRWTQLAAMSLDDLDAALPFSKRLAQENGWDRDYALRVTQEYKRFLYLSAAQVVPVTPSDPVDQAWHLHLTYSEHYWNLLCKYVLGGPLHHAPTRGGPSEARKYREGYARTLELYTESFGEFPPEDIWPDVEARFVNADRYQRVDTSRYLMVPLPAVLREPSVLIPVALTVGLAGCAVNSHGEGFGWQDLLLITGLAWLVRWLIKNYSGGGGSGCAGSGCGGCGGGCGG